jgi:hypothetical protein
MDRPKASLLLGLLYYMPFVHVSGIVIEVTNPYGWFVQLVFRGVGKGPVEPPRGTHGHVRRGERGRGRGS